VRFCGSNKLNGVLQRIADIHNIDLFALGGANGEHGLNDINEQFSHAGKTPFGYTPLGEELGHTGDTQMAEDILAGTLEHESLRDEVIQA
jgi:hypothetical protein